jgi:drug/metabolite transporter (DMT)-like permease
MEFLLLAIVCSTLNQLLFKVFERYRIDLLSAIVVNYAVCVAIGYGSSPMPLPLRATLGQNWYPYAILQGIILIVSFIAMGRTTEQHGVAVASLATRLSVIVPTVAAFLLYGDRVTVAKLAGIAVSLLALYLSSTDTPGPAHASRGLSTLPLFLCATFGACSMLLKYVQQKYLRSESYHAFVLSSFMWAFLIGATILAGRLVRKKQGWEWKNAVAGMALGCANYGAVYFLVRALSMPGWESSQLFPTVSIAVVSLSTLVAWAVFQERLPRRTLVALAIGLGSIALVNR